MQKFQILFVVLAVALRLPSALGQAVCTDQAAALSAYTSSVAGCDTNPSASNCLALVCTQNFLNDYYNLLVCEAAAASANSGVMALIEGCSATGHNGLVAPTGVTVNSPTAAAPPAATTAAVAATTAAAPPAASTTGAAKSGAVALRIGSLSVIAGLVMVLLL